MKLNSLVLIAVSIPTLAFAQNYRTQYIGTGAYAWDIISEIPPPPPGDPISPPKPGSNMEYRVQEAQATKARIQEVQFIKENASPNAPPQNFNESTPRMSKWKLNY